MQRKLRNSQQVNAAAPMELLTPTLTSMATHPTGITPTDMSKIQTSNMQTAGGGARRRRSRPKRSSAGGADEERAGLRMLRLPKSAEDAGQTLSKANLGAQIEDQNVKQGSAAGRLEGAGRVHGTNVNAWRTLPQDGK